ITIPIPKTKIVHNAIFTIFFITGRILTHSPKKRKNHLLEEKVEVVGINVLAPTTTTVEGGTEAPRKSAELLFVRGSVCSCLNVAKGILCDAHIIKQEGRILLDPLFPCAFSPKR